MNEGTIMIEVISPLKSFGDSCSPKLKNCKAGLGLTCSPGIETCICEFGALWYKGNCKLPLGAVYNGGIILSIVPIPTKQLTESPKNILNPAVDDQVIVIDVPHIPVEEPNEIYYGGVGVQPQNKTGEFVLPTPRPGVKVSVLNSSSIRCPFTKKISKTSSSYRHHMLSHQTDREASANFLPCASCNLEFQSLEHLQQHRILIHEYTGSGRGIFSSKDIPVSVKNSRGSVSFTVRLEPGLCQFPGCHFLAVTKEEAVDHYISLHSRCEDDIDQARHLGLGLIQFDVQEDNISPEIISRFMPTGSPPYNCEFCDFSARELDFLKNHLKSRHLSVIQSFEERQNVNVDRVDPAATDAIKSPKDPTPPSFSIIFPEQTFEFTLPDNQCPYCRKCVMCKGSWNPMKVHIREMHLWPLTGKKFKCSKCPRVFERRYVAKAHTQRCGQPDLRKMKKKGRVKTHCCEKCGKSFINAGCLKNHLDSRCGRVFSCEKISHTDEGRLKYNEMMRMKNRRRKLAQYQNAKDLKKQ
ncbi:unnamed protein product [Allacma fusca]|uniref:C2H2-type domain-containing protein n=1 Tax=Allacma fusca TaxID=39272 RepID=A0A8J2LD63_9HEXA|nr:unnamed protein product [Allacma fusca]